MAPVAGKARLDRIIKRVYLSAQSATSQEDYQLGSITLRLLGLIRKGEPPSLDVACAAAFGCSFRVWRERNLERKSRLAWELSQCVPDYDPEEARHAAMVKSGQMGRQAASGGTLYAMSAPEKRVVTQSLSQMPPTAARANAK
jgi:hypothetical protein